MTERENSECCIIRGYTKRYFNPPRWTIFSNMRVSTTVVVVLLAVLLVISSVMFIGLLPWTNETAGRSDDSSLSRNVASTELQSRMTSFLMRSSAVDEPTVSEFIIGSRSSATHSHGLTQLIFSSSLLP